MQIRDVEKILKDKYEVSKITKTENYVIKLGSKGCLTLQYVDGKFTKFIVDGKCKDDLEKTIYNYYKEK